MIIDNGVACHDIHFIGEKVYLAQSRRSSQPFIASGTGSNPLRACIAQRKVGGSYIPMVWGLQPEISISLLQSGKHHRGTGGIDPAMCMIPYM